MKHLLLIFACTALFKVQAQDFFKAQVLVKNFDELKISNAEVQLTDTTGAVVHKGITDLDGQFEITMKPGKYQVKLYIEGELKKDRSINLPVLSGQKIYNRVRIFVLYEERKQFVLEDLFFETNSAILEESSYLILDKLIEYLKYEEENRFEISGYTDNVGSEKSNQVLSENRAIAVVNYLAEHGIARERLMAKGYGELNPIADNETEEGRAKNRRTEIRKIESLKN